MAGQDEDQRTPPAKKRKLRKGTWSCWSCKRRKIKCSLVSPSPTGATRSCDGCKARGTLCISQGSLDDAPPAAKDDQMGSRLERLEAAIGQLASRTDSEKEIRRGTPRTLEWLPVGRPTLELSKSDEMYLALSAAWPSESDMDMLLQLPLAVPCRFHCEYHTPYSTFLAADMSSPRDLLRLPGPKTHPVLIARKLLLLSIVLQSVNPACTQNITGLGARYRNIMARAVDAASRLVTANDGLDVDSIEGIECMLMEGYYYHTAGSLRRAWIAVRRAMATAQMMRMHKGVASPTLSFFESESRARIKPEQTWFSIVHFDRYLSLMLDLPPGSLDNSFATLEALERCSATERMERICCVAAGRILQRDESDLYDIDALLQKASASMPAQWWLTPSPASFTGDHAAKLKLTIRVLLQFVYYHLVSLLHLPHILRFSADSRHDYSKEMAVNASRQVLARYVCASDLGLVPNPYSCSVDFLVPTASTVLSLAHVDVHQRAHAAHSIPFAFLGHQRLHDRGMLEYALESMEKRAGEGTDVVAFRIARILRPLLAFEADAAAGGSYATSSSSRGSEDLEGGGNVSDDGKVLHVYVPYFGAIRIERISSANTTSLGSLPPSGEQGLQLGLQYPVDQIHEEGETLQNHCEFKPGLEDDWGLQGVGEAIFEGLFRGALEGQR